MKKILYGLSVLSLAYFVQYIIQAGFTNKFVAVWLFFGLLCAVVGFCYDNIRKIVRIIGWGLFVAMVAVVGAVECPIIRAESQQTIKDADYVIVLGTLVNGTEPSDALVQRLDLAITYLKDNTNTKVVVSGGIGEGEKITEAECMYRYLVKHGISKERIIKEDQSSSTYENLKKSAKLINVNKRIVIITSKFHLFRSLSVAKKVGFKHVYGEGSDIKFYMIPNQYIREAIAVMKYWVCGQI